jgi:hypothetical protein
MEENLYDNLSLQEKAAWIQEKGQFIEAQDFYSFFVLIYLLNKEHIKLLYDFSGSLVSIESTNDEPEKDNFLSDQLMSEL